MNKQRTHEDSPTSDPNRSIVLLSDGVCSPANLGGLFRLADAFGVVEYVIGSGDLDMDSGRFRKTARNAYEQVPFTQTDDICGIISALKKEHYRIVALEITSQSTSLQHVEIPGSEPVGIVVGGERHGVSEGVLAMVDDTVHIDMFGINSSMNVVQATAIALYEISKT
ncbi:MAG: TrmH family RNA methyltransferase [Bacteroidota bacterium]